MNSSCLAVFIRNYFNKNDPINLCVSEDNLLLHFSEALLGNVVPLYEVDLSVEPSNRMTFNRFHPDQAWSGIIIGNFNNNE